MPSSEVRSLLQKFALPFQSAADLDGLFASLKGKEIVMLGESTHGTAEYYYWRAEISKRLIADHGFQFVAIEGDWPNSQRINSYIHQGEGSARQVLMQNHRWPTWMWANEETAKFIEWLKGRKTHFFGLDVYSFFESVDEVTSYLIENQPHLADKARELYRCFEPYGRNELEYAKKLIQYPAGCVKEITSILTSLLSDRIADDHLSFNAQQNARTMNNAENYYRSMILGSNNSWNIRDQHMMETLDLLHDRYGKGIVWAHNTHIGDYRATDMLETGHVNLGGLARIQYSEKKVYLLGFGTYQGSVTASHAWDGEEQKLPVPPAMQGSYEDEFHHYCHEKNIGQFYLPLGRQLRGSDLDIKRGHRAIGVVYQPRRERWGQYVPTQLASRYDGFIFIDKTRALESYKSRFDKKGFPETFPEGV